MIRLDPRIVTSLQAEIQVQKDRVVALPKDSQQRAAAEQHLKQLEDQFRRIDAGHMGVAQ